MLAAHFGREDFYDLDRTVEMPTNTLDDVAAGHGLASINFVDLEIERLEHEVIDGAQRLIGDENLGARFDLHHWRRRARLQAVKSALRRRFERLIGGGDTIR